MLELPSLLPFPAASSPATPPLSSSDQVFKAVQIAVVLPVVRRTQQGPAHTAGALLRHWSIIKGVRTFGYLS